MADAATIEYTVIEGMNDQPEHAMADSFERMVAAIKFFREHARPESEIDDDSLEAEEGADEGSATQE